MKRWLAALLALVCLGSAAQAEWFEPTPPPASAGSWAEKWDEVVELKCTPPKFLARRSGVYSLLDADGRVLKDAWLDGLDIFVNGTATIRIRGKWGVINEMGEILVEPVFDYASWFYDGLCRVELDGLRGFVNMDGEYVVEPKYFVARDFENGYAAVGEKVVGYTQEMSSDSGEGAVWGVIDTTGKVVVELKYDSLRFVESQGTAIAEIDGLYGLIDFEGNVLVPIVYEDISMTFIGMGVYACEKDDPAGGLDIAYDYFCMKDGQMVQIPYPEAAKEVLA